MFCQLFRFGEIISLDEAFYDMFRAIQLHTLNDRKRANRGGMSPAKRRVEDFSGITEARWRKRVAFWRPLPGLATTCRSSN